MAETITLTCGNPECLKEYRVHHPGVNKTANFKCPKCGHIDTVEFTTDGCKKVKPMAQPKAKAEDQPKPTTETPKTILAGHDDKKSEWDDEWASSCTMVQSNETAMLKVVRKPWQKKIEFELNNGISWTVGRTDSSRPSDISLDIDSTMSRQSVKINAFPKPGGRIYTFEVLNSKNPVVLNGRQLEIGEKVGLKEGASFVLGKTEFKFLVVK